MLLFVAENIIFQNNVHYFCYAIVSAFLKQLIWVGIKIMESLVHMLYIY